MELYKNKLLKNMMRFDATIPKRSEMLVGAMSIYNETDRNRRRDEPMVLRIGSEKPVTELHQIYGFMNSPCTENSSEYGTP